MNECTTDSKTRTGAVSPRPKQHAEHAVRHCRQSPAIDTRFIHKMTTLAKHSNRSIQSSGGFVFCFLARLANGAALGLCSRAARRRATDGWGGQVARQGGVGVDAEGRAGPEGVVVRDTRATSSKAMYAWTSPPPSSKCGRQREYEGK